MSSQRKVIVFRFLRVAGGVAVTGAIAALGSVDFRAFVGSDPLFAAIGGLLVPLLVAAEKKLRDGGKP